MKVIIINSVSTTGKRDELTNEVRAQYPEIEIYTVPTSGIFDPDQFSVDSILVVLFEEKQIADAYEGAIQKYKNEAGSAASYILISCSSVHYPEGELSRFKAIQASDDKYLANVTRRIGAFLGLITIPKENQIFISYRVTDGIKIAENLSVYLRSLGFGVWRDEDRDEDNEGNLTCGTEVQTTIMSAIQSSNLVVLVDTPQAPGSKYVRDEIDHANAHLIPVIPLCVRPNHTTKGSHFRNLKSLNRYIETDPSLSNLESIAIEVQDFLRDVYKRRRRIPALVEKKFLRTGFSWTPVTSSKLLYNAEKQKRFDLIRILSHLPTYEGVHNPLLGLYVSTINGQSQRCHNNLYIYDGTLLTQEDVDEIFKENQDAGLQNIKLIHHEQVEDFLNDT